MDGALKATSCGIMRGYLIYLFLGEVEKLSGKGFLKKWGTDATPKQATDDFGQIPLNLMNE